MDDLLENPNLTTAHIPIHARRQREYAMGQMSWAIGPHECGQCQHFIPGKITAKGKERETGRGCCQLYIAYDREVRRNKTKPPAFSGAAKCCRYFEGRGR